VSAESDSLKIGRTTLKVRNLPFCASCVYDANPQNGFKQTDFLRSVSPIFLTLTSQGGNQGIANAMDKKTNPSLRNSVFCIANINLRPLFPMSLFTSLTTSLTTNLTTG